jgi:hypothetical protein
MHEMIIYYDSVIVDDIDEEGVPMPTTDDFQLIF